MAIKGLSFDAEQFWPFMFGSWMMATCTSRWVSGNSSIVRLDGLAKVRRIDLGTVNATAEMIAARGTRSSGGGVQEHHAR